MDDAIHRNSWSPDGYQKRGKVMSNTRIIFSASVIALSAFAVTARGEDRAESIETATPIKHVIVVIAENRSFDHIFGVYKPGSGQSIDNLLSRGIVKEDGTPGPNVRSAAQFTVLPQARYFIGAPDSNKIAYVTLPPPDLGGVPTAGSDTNPPPFATVAAAQAAEPSLLPADAVLLTTGASGLPATSGPDTRIANVTFLPNGPFQMTAKDPRTGQGLPYDAYTQDMVHRFFQMWQQSDCDIRNATGRNPAGCLSDLYPFVTTTFLAPSQAGSGSPMGFINMTAGDAPFLKRLAERYTLADNYHQAVMGGSGPNHIVLGTADMLFFSDGAGHPLPPPPLLLPGFPPISLVANPD